MSLINVTNISVGNNVCPVTDPLVFQIEFECLENLRNDVEWKVVYVTSDGLGYIDEETQANTENKNGEIVLDEVCLGPVYRGILEFEFRVAPPDFTRLNPNGILGMQAVLVTASYRDQEFIRIGYYTNNCYEDPELRESPPDDPIISKMVRCIIDQPRVTRFPIVWDNDTSLEEDAQNISSVIDDSSGSYSSDEDNDDVGLSSSCSENKFSESASLDPRDESLEESQSCTTRSSLKRSSEASSDDEHGRSRKPRVINPSVSISTCTSISDS